MSERRRERVGSRKTGRTRNSVAREAAVVMVQEGVSEYFTAKRIAARRLHGERSCDLPSNGEIRAEILRLAEQSEGPDRGQRLFAMRVEALRLLRALERWQARLIGSVASGHARKGSDIDVHLFGDLDAVREDLAARGWRVEHEEVQIRAGAGFRTYHHLRMDTRFPVELSVYPLAERFEVQLSSVDGRPIRRLSASVVERLLVEEHGPEWAAFQRTGVVAFVEAEAGGEFDGLLRLLRGP